MICKNCGLENDDRSNFCSGCGAKLRSECACWVIGGWFNCGRSECPGYLLYKLILEAYALEETDPTSLTR